MSVWEISLTSSCLIVPAEIRDSSNFLFSCTIFKFALRSRCEIPSILGGVGYSRSTGFIKLATGQTRSGGSLTSRQDSVPRYPTSWIHRAPVGSWIHSGHLVHRQLRDKKIILRIEQEGLGGHTNAITYRTGHGKILMGTPRRRTAGARPAKAVLPDRRTSTLTSEERETPF